MSMTYKPFDQMYKEITQSVRSRKPGASTPTEDLEYRRIVSRVVVHVLSLGIIAAAVQVIFQPQPGSTWAMSGAVVGLLFAMATTRTEIDKARLRWRHVASGEFLIEHLLNESVAKQEQLKALEARVDGKRTEVVAGIENRELTLSDLAAEYDLAVAENRGADAKALWDAMDKLRAADRKAAFEACEAKRQASGAKDTD